MVADGTIIFEVTQRGAVMSDCDTSEQWSTGHDGGVRRRDSDEETKTEAAGRRELPPALAGSMVVSGTS